MGQGTPGGMGKHGGASTGRNKSAAAAASAQAAAQQNDEEEAPYTARTQNVQLHMVGFAKDVVLKQRRRMPRGGIPPTSARRSKPPSFSWRSPPPFFHEIRRLPVAPELDRLHRQPLQDCFRGTGSFVCKLQFGEEAPATAGISITDVLRISHGSLWEGDWIL